MCSKLIVARLPNPLKSCEHDWSLNLGTQSSAQVSWRQRTLISRISSTAAGNTRALPRTQFEVQQLLTILGTPCSKPNNWSYLVVLVGRRLLLADALDVGARRAEERPRRLEGREQTRLFHDRARRLSQRGPGRKVGVVGRGE